MLEINNWYRFVIFLNGYKVVDGYLVHISDINVYYFLVPHILHLRRAGNLPIIEKLNISKFVRHQHILFDVCADELDRRNIRKIEALYDL